MLSDLLVKTQCYNMILENLVSFTYMLFDLLFTLKKNKKAYMAKKATTISVLNKMQTSISITLNSLQVSIFLLKITDGQFLPVSA